MSFLHSTDDCRLCDFTKGQIWLPDTNNCHMFYVCEPIGYLEYRKHHMTCGVLWWQQDIHTCVMEPPVGCDVTAPVVTYEIKSTTRGKTQRTNTAQFSYFIKQIVLCIFYLYFHSKCRIVDTTGVCVPLFGNAQDVVVCLCYSHTYARVLRQAFPLQTTFYM